MQFSVRTESLIILFCCIVALFGYDAFLGQPPPPIRKWPIGLGSCMPINVN